MKNNIYQLSYIGAQGFHKNNNVYTIEMIEDFNMDIKPTVEEIEFSKKFYLERLNLYLSIGESENPRILFNYLSQ